MRLESVSARHFRNFEAVDFVPGPSVNLFLGANGQGKTNLAEALYFLATLKLLRKGKPQEAVAWGQPSARVSGSLLRAGIHHELEVAIESGTRSQRIDGKPVPPGRYVEQLRAVAFTPQDLNMLVLGPPLRRAALDRMTLNRFPPYLDHYQRHAYALASRNKLLKAAKTARGPVPWPQVQAWDEALAEHGGVVSALRHKVLAEIRELAAANYARIAPADPPLTLMLESPLAVPLGANPDAVELAGLYRRGLGIHRDADAAAGYTTFGPQRDDLRFTLGGRPMLQNASQGQRRTAVLAVKIAEMKNLHAVLREPPLLLFDDVTSELDPPRNAMLFELLGELPAQVFLTTTDLGRLPQAVLAGAKAWRLEAGRIAEMPAAG